jgi:hypothetical protein
MAELRPLTEAERGALIAAVRDVERTGRPCSFPDVLAALGFRLGYDFKGTNYNGFVRAKAFFDQAVKDGIIEYGTFAGPAPTIRLPERNGSHRYG